MPITKREYDELESAIGTFEAMLGAGCEEADKGFKLHIKFLKSIAKKYKLNS